MRCLYKGGISGLFVYQGKGIIEFFVWPFSELVGRCVYKILSTQIIGKFKKHQLSLAAKSAASAFEWEYLNISYRFLTTIAISVY